MRLFTRKHKEPEKPKNWAKCACCGQGIWSYGEIPPGAECLMCQNGMTEESKWREKERRLYELMKMAIREVAAESANHTGQGRPESKGQDHANK